MVDCEVEEAEERESDKNEWQVVGDYIYYLLAVKILQIKFKLFFVFIFAAVVEWDLTVEFMHSFPRFAHPQIGNAKICI